MTGGLPRMRRHHTAFVVVALVVASLLGASPASAHSTLERSEPPNGGKIGVGRSTLTLWFSEPISVAASTFGLHTLDGAPIAATVAGSGAARTRLVEVETEPLAKETYLLDWTALSVDGHRSTGSVVFGVGVRPAVAPSGGDGLPPAPELLLRWLDLSAIMLAIGALAVSGRVLGSIGAVGDAPLQRARTIGALAAGAAIATGAITPLLRTPRGGSSLGVWFDTTWTTLAGTPWGHLWLSRELALVVAAAALWSWAAPGRSGSSRGAHAGVCALAAVVLLEAWAGHAADLPRQSVLAALASASHLAAAGVWAGGLAVLALCVIPVMRRSPESRGRILASVWRAFSPIAAIATVVLLATGLYESGRHLPDLQSVGSTVYGDAVAGKVGLFAVALILAGFNTLLVNPRLAAPVRRLLGRPPEWSPVPPHRFATLAVAEIMVIVVAVVGAAVLTSVPTSRELGAVVEKTTPSAANVDGLFVTFEGVPAGPDQTRLIVQAHSTVKPERGPIRGVDVRLAGPTGTRADISLEEIEPGRYEAETSTLTSGAWQASVAVQRDGRPDAVTHADWTVAAAAPEDVSPFESVTTTLAVLLLAAVAGAVSFARVRRQRPAGWAPRVDKESGRQR